MSGKIKNWPRRCRRSLAEASAYFISGEVRNWPRRCAAGCVRAYQLVLSPVKKLLFGPHAGCRFYPTCSEYARQAFLQHGFWKGFRLSLFRLLKCHPFHPGGEDPVPPAKPCGTCPGHHKAGGSGVLPAKPQN